MTGPMALSWVVILVQKVGPRPAMRSRGVAAVLLADVQRDD